MVETWGASPHVPCIPRQQGQWRWWGQCCVRRCQVAFLHVSTCLHVPCTSQDTGPVVTPGPALCAEARGAAQRLLDHYVQVQGAAVAQMLRKSVETRDWLGTVEPRNVRAVMKRVVEDITAIDVQVGATPGAQRDWGWS